MRLPERHGAVVLEDGSTRFRIWAPLRKRVDLHIVAPYDKLVPMTRQDEFFHVTIKDAGPGTRYLFRLDEKDERPDPASRLQPENVHGPSEVVSRAFEWNDRAWFGIPRADLVVYELHVGLFTPQGTFEAIIPHLDWLRDLGVNALELMPINEFPGARNWGYDGVYPWSAHSAYGGPDSLKRLVNAAHDRGIAVILDVVYNHLGPEGNYLPMYAPYFTSRYKTPWGNAINFDGEYSDEVRRYFIASAVYWVEECHIDGLRLDAVQAIVDHSAVTFLEVLARKLHQTGREVNRRVHLIAENDLNDPRHVMPPEFGGYGLDVNWNDDFHHAIFTMVFDEAKGYYEDYGKLSHVAKAYRDGYVLADNYSVYRKKHHGRSSVHLKGEQLLIFIQNHDQVGNRPRGERLNHCVNHEALKLAAAAMLLAPSIPMLFMGEEYAEDAPFLYFTSHTDKELIESVRKGRAEEFAHFLQGETPSDPQSEETFLK